MSRQPGFIHCGSCESLHPDGFTGDCRDDANRFLAHQLDAQFGPSGWDLHDSPNNNQGDVHDHFDQ